MLKFVCTISVALALSEVCSGNPFVRNSRRLAPETCVQAFKPADRLGCGSDCGEAELDTIHPYPGPRKPGASLHPCAEFSDLSCCSNVGAQEIGDAFDHLMNVGGSGGVPVNDERCFLKAKSEHIALKDYMCMYCNPHQTKYFGCCDKVANDTMSCLGTLKKHGDSGCGSSDVNTLRICKSFATELWGKDGTKYDGCGMMMWVADPVSEEDPANPYNWLSWGALEGKHGDDPVTPSVTWNKDVKEFFRDVKPPLFDQFYVIVVPDDDSCFKGYVLNGVGAGAGSITVSFASVLAATAVTLMTLFRY